MEKKEKHFLPPCRKWDRRLLCGIFILWLPPLSPQKVTNLVLNCSDFVLSSLHQTRKDHHPDLQITIYIYFSPQDQLTHLCCITLNTDGGTSDNVLKATIGLQNKYPEQEILDGDAQWLPKACRKSWETGTMEKATHMFK
jgi:hypothetical protein